MGGLGGADTGKCQHGHQAQHKTAHPVPWLLYLCHSSSYQRPIPDTKRNSGSRAKARPTTSPTRQSDGPPRPASTAHHTMVTPRQATLTHTPARSIYYELPGTLVHM